MGNVLVIRLFTSPNYQQNEFLGGDLFALNWPDDGGGVEGDHEEEVEDRRQDQGESVSRSQKERERKKGYFHVFSFPTVNWNFPSISSLHSCDLPETLYCQQETVWRGDFLHYGQVTPTEELHRHEQRSDCVGGYQGADQAYVDIGTAHQVLGADHGDEDDQVCREANH